MSITYWIQRADFRSDEFDAVSEANAQQALKEHDWPAELDYMDELEAAGTETCPPGIGFVSDDGRILHICPERNGRAMMHYHFTSSWRLLWLIPMSGEGLQTRDDMPFAEAGKLLSNFFANDHDRLIRYAEAKG